jgi:hypothetical protein
MAGDSLCRAVDFTPITKTRRFEGIEKTYVAFRDGAREITYSPPKDWRLNGSGSKLTLAPNSIRNVDAQIEIKSVAAVVPIDATNVKKYVEVAQKTVPRDALNVQILGSTINPLKINGHDTLAIDLQYEAFGATYRSHLLYLNRDREQWVFQVSAPEKPFELAFEQFRMSLYSFDGL